MKRACFLCSVSGKSASRIVRADMQGILSKNESAFIFELERKWEDRAE